jgi:peroxiredoxin
MPCSGSGDYDVARHLVLGLPLPDISLPSTLGGRLNLSVLPGEAVIYFYPWTGRPGFADPHQRELAGRLNIPFAILSDEAFLLQKALNLPTFEAGGIAYLKRLTLVVREGRIEKFFYPVAKTGGHARAVLAWLTRQGISGLA